jgi:aspartate/methionine/tyrosine aminotransferase
LTLRGVVAAVNLGQGFPNWFSPEFVKQSLAAATLSNENQYCRSAGHPALVAAIADTYTRNLGYSVSAEKEVCVYVIAECVRGCVFAECVAWPNVV